MKLLFLSGTCYLIVLLLSIGFIEAFLPDPLLQRRTSSRIHISTLDDEESSSSSSDTDDSLSHYRLQADDDRRRRLLQSALVSVATGAASTLVSPPVAAAAATSTEYLVPTPPLTKEMSWPLGKVAFSLLPLAGTSTRRATVEECLVPDTIWTHDQIQGVVNVNVPVRQTVVKLKGGGLWVHNPVAPTPQLIGMMKRLVQQHGPVKHIVLGSAALEHKATFGAFASYFPNATVWLQPGQWSFPLQVPIEFNGLVQRGPRLREIPVPGKEPTLGYRYYASKDPVPEWMSDFEYEVLGPLQFKSVGCFSETAFFHKDTKSLIVTDCVVSVTADPPAIIQEDPRALLFHARDNATDDRVLVGVDTVEMRQRGWRRMVQFGLIFFPSQITVSSTVREAWQQARQVPAQLRNLGEGAVPGTLYPWSWKADDADQVNFDAISQSGKLFCPPILTKLILDREPERTLAFVDQVATRFPDMKRIIPCHLNNNIPVTGSKEFYQAFDPLRSRPGKLVPQRALAEDLALLQKASDRLTELGVVAPSEICDGEPARTEGRFRVAPKTS